MTLLFFNISAGEILFVLLIALLLFGAKGFPNMARRLGQGIQQVRRASGELQQDIRESADQVRDSIDQAKPRDPGRSSKEDQDRKGEGS
jgi:TatA/E family protein of Tat protein translocase